jgi:hypothetical protein
MPRFVLLYHDCPPNYERASHWDLMLESGDVLFTWALERLPRDWHAVHARTAAIYPDCSPLSSANQVSAERLGEHRRDYLQMEGPLSGDRGTVVRVAAGTYAGNGELPGRWQIVLAGTELLGLVTLTQSDTDDSRWSLEHRPSA